MKRVITIAVLFATLLTNCASNEQRRYPRSYEEWERIQDGETDVPQAYRFHPSHIDPPPATGIYVE